MENARSWKSHGKVMEFDRSWKKSWKMIGHGKRVMENDQVRHMQGGCSGYIPVILPILFVGGWSMLYPTNVVAVLNNILILPTLQLIELSLTNHCHTIS